MPAAYLQTARDDVVRLLVAGHQYADVVRHVDLHKQVRS